MKLPLNLHFSWLLQPAQRRHVAPVAQITRQARVGVETWTLNSVKPNSLPT
jgi:hypothetical protein